jgi:hypothetical protein
MNEPLEVGMDCKLHLLESFAAEGSDGAAYKVCVYERMARDASIVGADELWEPTGIAEYRTSDGALVDVRPDGSMRIVRSGVALRAAARSLQGMTA